jgi:hypothetical protein
MHLFACFLICIFVPDHPGLTASFHYLGRLKADFLTFISEHTSCIEQKIDPPFARAHFRSVISSGEVSTIKVAIQSVRTKRK